LAIAWLVHLYTASSAVLAFLSARAVIEHRYRDAFLWLAVSVIVDATDGTFARLADVSTRISWFNGAKLDDIVDYLTYVFIPALLVWRAVMVPERWTVGVVSAMLLSSAYGFNRDDAKTRDHFYTGFPSYWNIVVFYLFVARWPSQVNAAILVILAALVFVPIRYVYPSRTPIWRRTTIMLGAVWGLLMVWMLWRLPAVPSWIVLASLFFPAYYVGLSLVLMVQSGGRVLRSRPGGSKRTRPPYER
jgi:phosphatidylcholine synthase